MARSIAMRATFGPSDVCLASVLSPHDTLANSSPHSSMRIAGTLCELVTGVPLFPGESEQDVLDRVLCYYSDTHSEGVRQRLLSRGLAINKPALRKTFHADLAIVGT